MVALWFAAFVLLAVVQVVDVLCYRVFSNVIPPSSKAITDSSPFCFVPSNRISLLLFSGNPDAYGTGVARSRVSSM